MCSLRDIYICEDISVLVYQALLIPTQVTQDQRIRRRLEFMFKLKFFHLPFSFRYPPQQLERILGIIILLHNKFKSESKLGEDTLQKFQVDARWC